MGPETRDWYSAAQRAPRRQRHAGPAAALARVHGGDELDAGRIQDAMIGARDDDLAGLEGLAERIEDVGLILGQFVQEQYAQMREACFAGLWTRAAADEGGHAGGVMRRAKRAVEAEFAAHEFAGERVDHRDFEHFFRRERRQDGGQAGGEHGFARTRRADHQQVVASSGGDFECALGAFLAAHIA